MEINVIRCPNCGGDVRLDGSEDTFYCDYCGSLLGIERDADNPKPVLIHSTRKRSRARTGVRKRDRNTPPSPRILFYLIAFILPILGFIWALQYWRSDNELAKTFAKVCIAVAILNFVFEGIFIGLMIIISVVAGVS